MLNSVIRKSIGSDKNGRRYRSVLELLRIACEQGYTSAALMEAVSSIPASNKGSDLYKGVLSSRDLGTLVENLLGVKRANIGDALVNLMTLPRRLRRLGVKLIKS